MAIGYCQLLESLMLNSGMDGWVLEAMRVLVNHTNTRLKVVAIQFQIQAVDMGNSVIQEYFMKCGRASMGMPCMSEDCKSSLCS